jgi:3-hydroxyisobutyrate dehydrogenase-like beta-hydroxyacid dehydrogenase
MDIGFIGLGKMGFPMARRLIEAKHQLVAFDQRKEAVDRLVVLGAQAASSTTCGAPCGRTWSLSA